MGGGGTGGPGAGGPGAGPGGGGGPHAQVWLTAVHAAGVFDALHAGPYADGAPGLRWQSGGATGPPPLQAQVSLSFAQAIEVFTSWQIAP